MDSFKSQQVPALDGIRGIAILLVIIHHQLIPISLSGGFLGVDLFFVLSGFLITRLLLKEFKTSGSISLSNFYARRALRLAPALLLYLLFALILIRILNPQEFLREVKLVGLSLVYLTNWRMAFGWDYSLDPTAIIWSLSIEEQFYLLWPPVLLLLLSTRVKLFHIAAALSLIVIAVGFHRASLWSEGSELNRMYYGTDTRADALFAGCLFAFLAQLRLPTRLRSALHVMALSAVVLLAYAICTVSFTGQFLYRGGSTLIALATGILIWSLSESQDSWLARVLAFYPLRWFGFISYSLYLWHWLLLRNVSFYYFVGDWDGWMRLLAAIAIAAGSFYLVESRVNKFKTRFSYASNATRKDSREVNAPLVVSFIQPSEQNS
jgi:peptidoglycan/LPS O-acetylase OafA/YrhL